MLGYWGIGALFSLVPIELPTFAPFGIDRQVLAFTFGLTLITGILFGIFPALASPDSRLGELLKQGGRGSSTGEGHQLFKEALVVSEVALALVLLVSAGLMIRSFIGIMQRNPGFDPNNRLTASIQLRAEQYCQPHKQNRRRGIASIEHRQRKKAGTRQVQSYILRIRGPDVKHV